MTAGSPYFDALAAAFRRDVPPSSREVHPDEGMIEPVPEGRDHYFRVGRSALDAVGLALLAAGAAAPRRVLDLPCGHGRVLRVLRGAFPDAEVTACDLLRGGVDFCAGTLGAVPAYSADPIARAGIAGPFDLVWVGSLLTHLAEPGWDEFLAFFHGALADGGVCVVTTHGRHVAGLIRADARRFGLADARRLLRRYDRSGFGFAPYERGGRYGVSLSGQSWVADRVRRLPGGRVVFAAERFWDDSQDVLAWQKRA